MLIKLLAVLLGIVVSTSAFADGFRAEVGKSLRQGAMNASVSYEFMIGDVSMGDVSVGPELEYIDFGRQPHTDTRNRAVNLNVRGSIRDGFIEPFVKVGLTSTYFSDPYNDYDWDKGFKGWNVGVGLNVYTSKNFYIQAYVNNIRYVQCSQDGMNDYLYYSVGIGYNMN